MTEIVIEDIESDYESIQEQDEIENDEESALSDSSLQISDDDKDQDYLIVPANGRTKTKTVPCQTIKLAISANPEKPSKKFTCDYCEQTFKAKQGLTRHVQSHIENSVPWKCDAYGCHYATSSKIKLNSHKLVSHAIPIPSPKIPKGVVEQEKKEFVNPPAEKNVVASFACFCGASFNSLFSLRAHKK